MSDARREVAEKSSKVLRVSGFALLGLAGILFVISSLLKPDLVEDFMIERAPSAADGSQLRVTVQLTRPAFVRCLVFDGELRPRLVPEIPAVSDEGRATIVVPTDEDGSPDRVSYAAIVVTEEEPPEPEALAGSLPERLVPPDKLWDTGKGKRMIRELLRDLRSRLGCETRFGPAPD